MYQKILVPLDGSALAEAALAHADALARRTNATICLFRVTQYALQELTLPDPNIVTGVLQDDVQADADAYLARVAAKLSANGTRVQTRVGDGDVAEAILRCADDIQADLIAMSTHGRSGMARWLLGSIADRIVRGATGPVLLVRPSNGHTS